MEFRSVSKDGSDLIRRLHGALQDTNIEPGSLNDLFVEIRSFLKTASSDDIHVDTQCNVYTMKVHINVIEMLLDYYSLDWHKKDEQDRSLDLSFEGILVHGPREATLTALVSRISSLRPGLKCLRFISLLELLIKREKFLQKLISSECLEARQGEVDSTRRTMGSTSNMLWQPILSLIASLPDIILPKSHLHSSSDFFQSHTYISFLWADIQTILQTVYTRLQNSESCSVAFLSQLLGKLCMTGSGTQLWAEILRHNESIIANDFLWQRIWQKIIADVPDRWMEQSIVPLILAASSSQTLKFFFGTLPTNKCKLSFVLTYKLLAVRCYESSHVIQNIIWYLASDKDLKPLFKKAFETVLHAWADGNSLKHRPHEQSLYICKTVIVGVACLRQDEDLVNDVREFMRKAVLRGLTYYLESSEANIRQMGCFVAEQLSEFIKVSDSKEHVLNFSLVSDSITETLSKLLTVPELNSVSCDVGSNDAAARNASMNNNNDVPIAEVSENKSDRRSEENKNDRPTRAERVISKQSNKLIQELDTDDDDDDDDDDLKPMPQSTGNQPRNRKQPVYISQCLDGLIHAGDDAELVEQCLAAAESLVRSHSEITEIAAEMTKVLLHLEDRFNLPDFMLNRHRTMVALAVMAPESVVPYMTGEVYARNYSMSQRFDVLGVLSAAARELSSPTASAEHKSKSNCNSSSQSGNYNNKIGTLASKVKSNSLNMSIVKPWQEVVQERIESKTRRFAQGPARPAPVATTNKLARVVGLFFYPLMRDFDRTDRGDHLDLLGKDHILLQRLLSTLGVVMYAATNTPEAGTMARALVQFSWFLRGHTRASIRQAVLYAVCMAMAAVPGGVLMERLEDELVELRGWLDDVRYSDADSECRQLAEQCFYLLCSAVQKQLSN